MNKKYTRTLIDEISSSEAKFKHDNLTTKKCPECNHFMLEVNGKKGKMLVCSNPDCKHRESVPSSQMLAVLIVIKN